MTKNNNFYYLGKSIYKFRWAIVLIYCLAMLVCIPFAPRVISQFKDTGFVDPHSESAKTDVLLDKQLGYRHNQLLVLYKSKNTFNDPEFMREIKQSLSGLKSFPLQHEIIYPDTNSQQVSKDKHSAFVVVLLKKTTELSEKNLAEFKSAIKKPPHLMMKMGGQPIFMNDTKQETRTDLIKAELIASPIALITLLIVFGTFAATLVPMVLDGFCALFILAILYGLGNYFSLSIFTLNIALLLGLCLSLDYALFIISRFRDELAEGHSAEEALALTVATAGEAVFFSGVAVFISLSALLMFPINILFSVGMGGITAVGVAVIVSVIFLPALLGILSKKINFLPIFSFAQKESIHHKYWQWLVNKVVAFPLSFFIFIMSLLLLLGYPFLSVTFGISDFKILPKQAESRQVFDHIQADFKDNQLSPIFVVVQAKNGAILTKENIARLYHYTEKLKKDPRIAELNSIVNTSPALTKNQYQMLYTQGRETRSSAAKQFLKLSTNRNLTVVTILSKYPPESAQSQKLIKTIRNTPVNSGLAVKVSGLPANTVDVLHTIGKLFPYALLWIMGLTYLVLLILLRSVILPLKAILMTILSLCASYGILVFIVQKGYLAHLLNFQAQGMLDISLLIIIFCALFGFSMDYEVFLLTRIKEYYDKTGDNLKSICFGITRSSKIITSAAVIVILICFAFISANVVLVKAFGLGIAVAIFVDAFMIRTLLVPAIMTMLGKWNWYLPKWLGKIIPHRLSRH